jgi:uncharacterized protein (TIGR04255 family)
MNDIKLQKNPINKCLIQVNFSAIMIIEKSIPEIQDTYRKNGFPNFKEIEVSNYDLTPQNNIPTISKSKKWLFYTADEKDLIILDNTQISYQVSTYKTFLEFQKSFKIILDKFSKIVDFTNETVINRIGLRYVNSFEGLDKFKKYLKNEYQGISLSEDMKTVNTPLINTSLRCPIKINEKNFSNLSLRVYQNNNGIEVPLNIYSLQEVKQKEDTLISFLDIDQGLNFKDFLLTNLEDIYKFTKQLNEISTKLFWGAITEDAKRDWK